MFAVDSYQTKFFQEQVGAVKKKRETVSSFNEFLTRELSVQLIRELSIPSRFSRAELGNFVSRYLLNLIERNALVKKVADAIYEYFNSPEDPQKFKNYREKVMSFSSEKEKVLNKMLNNISFLYFTSDFSSSLINSFALFLLTELGFLEYFKFALERLKVRALYMKKGFRKTIAKRKFKEYIDELMPKLEKYVEAKLWYLKLMFFIDVWNSEELNQLFKPKRLSLKKVDQSAYLFLFRNFRQNMRLLRRTIYLEGLRVNRNFFEKYIPETSRRAELAWSHLVRSILSS